MLWLFFSGWDAWSRGPHPLEISLMFPTGSFSGLGQLDVFQVFCHVQGLGQLLAIFASWWWERWTRSFCSARPPAAGSGGGSGGAECTVLCQPAGQVPSNTFCKIVLSKSIILKFGVPEGQCLKNLMQLSRRMVTLGDRRDGERLGWTLGLFSLEKSPGRS